MMRQSRRGSKPQRSKPLYRQGLVGLILCAASLTLAQSVPTSLDEMRTLLQEGLYALAAQVEGPELVRALPGNAEAHFLYARALYLTGDLATAEAQLQEARTLGEPKTEHTQLEALITASRGDLVGAQALLEAAFAQAPSYSVAMDLGRITWQAGDFAGTLSAYEAATQTPQGERAPWPHLHRARLLAIQGNYEESIKMWNDALNVLDSASLETEGATDALPSPAYVEAFYGLGEAYEALGELDQAAANYTAALAADPSFEPATDALARLDETSR